ncbi:MAG: hypothetical protein N2109_00660 [Fimbriimonadales bacterium]|nr:hypothetical protein [Fimbriimonadales bacterium]
MRLARWVLALLALAAVGCGGSEQPLEQPSKAPAREVDPWALSTSDPNGEPAFVSNGLIGGRMNRFGIGKDAQGRFLPFLAIDVRQPSGEEKILPLTNPLGLRWFVGDREIAPDTEGPVRQTIRFRDSVVESVWSAKIDGHPHRFVCRTVVARNSRVVAQRWTVSPEAKGLRAAPIEPWPTGEHGVFRIADLPVAIRGRMVRGEAGWDWIVAVGKPPGSPATDALADVSEWTFDRALSESQAFWRDRWKTDVEIDGPAEDQQAVRAQLFQLRANTNPLSNFAPGPFGLTATNYNGHVFWDADVWIFPALALLDPDLAATIPSYRLRMFDKRKRAGLKPGEQPFPWESSVTGLETIPGPSRKQIHIVGSVCWMLHLASRLGMVESATLQAVFDASAEFYRQRAVRGASGLLELRDVMSPDEFHIGNNDLYTNLLAEWLLRGRRWQEEPLFVRPMVEGHLATYDGDRLRGYKQTAALLALYPLQNPEAEAQSEAMLNAFLGKTAENGPAMSQSIEALLLARFRDSESAYELWRRSWRRYTTGALGLFHEKPRRESAVFLTGAAGCLQTILYGFAGFRIDSKKQEMAGWSTRLGTDGWLSIQPALPRAWRSLKLKNLHVRGQRVSFTITADKITTHQGD